MKNAVLVSLVILVVLFAIYQYDPTFFGLISQYDGFENGAGKMADSNNSQKAGQNATPGAAVAASTASNPNVANPPAPSAPAPSPAPAPASATDKKKEGFADLSAYEGPANFSGAEAPAGCYPRDQLTPAELLPKGSGAWSEQNPMGPGSLKGKNFLAAGALLGVNTVGQSLRNANLQLRSEPPNPQQAVSVFNQSTITPDISHRNLEIGSA